MNRHIPINDLPIGIPEKFRCREGSFEYWHPQGKACTTSRITHRLNSYGYRCPEFSASAEIKVVSFGCSVGFGQSIQQEDICHEIVAKRIGAELHCSTIHWNLSMPGSSNDSIARRVFLSLPILKPDVVLVLFSAPARREYCGPSGEIYALHPGLHQPPGAEYQNAYHHYQELLSEPDNELNLYRNYKAIEAALRDTVWLCSFWDQQSARCLGKHLDQKHYAGTMHAPFKDFGDDRGHPGSQTNEDLAERYWQKIEQNNWLETLRRWLGLKAAGRNSYQNIG